MRILVCGDRDWTDWDIIKTVILGALQFEPDYLVVIEGEARGADSIAKGICLEHNIACQGYPADWGQYGRSAGPIRNQQMLDEGKPEAVFAFHSDLARSKGTKDMVGRAKKAGLPVYVIGKA